jgi:hypothetical protein
MEGKLRDKTRNQTRMGLGIIPFIEMTELAWLRWYGHVVRMGVRDTPKFPVKLEHREKTSKGRPGQTREKWIQKILKRN